RARRRMLRIISPVMGPAPLIAPCGLTRDGVAQPRQRSALTAGIPQGDHLDFDPGPGSGRTKEGIAIGVIKGPIPGWHMMVKIAGRIDRTLLLAGDRRYGGGTKDNNLGHTARGAIIEPAVTDHVDRAREANENIIIRQGTLKRTVHNIQKV